LPHHDTIISAANKSSLIISGGLLGYLAKHEGEISIILTIFTFLFTAISLLCSIYCQIQRNKRDEIRLQQDSEIFERRLLEKQDTGERRRESD
jgi:hypothetical protein